MPKKKSIVIVSLLFGCVALGGISGVALRGKYENTVGRLVPSDVYATETAKIRDDNSPIMGGHSTANYFEAVLQLVSDEYVDPVTDPKKFAQGAIRFMLQRLDDAGSRFYDEKEWPAYLGMFEGKYQGIGADLIVKRIGTEGKYEFPLIVASVADGGPSQRAGLATGDVIDEIDGRWIASRSLLIDLDAKNAELQAKKITEEQFDIFLKQLRKSAETLITIYKAMTDLTATAGPQVSLRIIRNGKPIVLKVSREGVEVETIESINGVIRIRSFGSGVAERLQELIANKNELTLDLRGNPGGSWEVMESCLALLIPSGKWGGIRNEPGQPIQPLKIDNGVAITRKLRVLVDNGTAREAEMFVAGLRDRCKAEVIGAPTLGMGIQSKRFPLVDGSGYTLTSGRIFDINDKPLFREEVILSGISAANEKKL